MLENGMTWNGKIIKNGMEYYERITWTRHQSDFDLVEN